MKEEIEMKTAVGFVACVLLQRGMRWLQTDATSAVGVLPAMTPGRRKDQASTRAQRDRWPASRHVEGYTIRTPEGSVITGTGIVKEYIGAPMQKSLATRTGLCGLALSQ